MADNAAAGHVLKADGVGVGGVVARKLNAIRELIHRRRWTRRRIESLDPNTDHVEIVRLSNLYTVGSMQLDWLYTLNTISASIAPAVIDTVFRDGRGKYQTHSGKRAEETIDHLLVWFEHGADAAPTKNSLDIVNASHRYYSKKYPLGLAQVDDYIYILCLNGTSVHTSMRVLGLPGHSDKEKQAAHILWSKLAEQFEHVTEGGSITDVKAFPETFDEMVDFVEEYQGRPWPFHQPGSRSTHGAIQHFAERWFPRPLHFFGRALVTSFLCPTVLRVHAVQPPHRALAWAAQAAMKIAVITQTHVLTDPVESLPDRRRRQIATKKRKPSRIDTVVHRASGSGCPHLAHVPREGAPSEPSLWTR